ncbi:MAG: TolC family outer membrane protein [Gammaproteobacteria bacterium]|nr:TolC family outer membrane protein [Gammaproteobacteria bacterium]NND39999.1 TolC family outer membrane protein [Pseudomonadales bacterium]MBT8151345.1 TolC family outer membrane protein [Gammaproteobacteria bacterium]NNL10398.1 TolC family outer membrane protein [Pseudomonadales bacterium]NNM12245.1 TolC family outer membrane protein [Pseudomonadales bacterium]
MRPIKFRPLSLIGLCSVFAYLGSQVASATTLQDIYDLAVNNDPEIQAAYAEYRAGDTLRGQARGVLLPQLNASYTFTDTNKTLLESEEEKEEYGVTLSQSILNLPAVYSYAQSKAVAKQSQLTFHVAEQDLIVRVAEAYFNVLRGRDNLASARAEEKAIAQQLEQTQQRYEVGLIAITDVHEAQAAYDLAIANRLTEEVNLGISREALAAITGQAHHNLQELAMEFPISAPEPNNEESWVEFATANNLSIQLAEQVLEAANQNARIANSEAAPTVQASARYIKDEPFQFASSSGVSKAEGMIMQLSVDLPIFSGGSRHAERKQAGFERVAEQSNLVATKRRVLQETRSNFLTTVADTARVQARKRAITSAQSALDATEAGYEAGTRNIVDLLNAQRDLYRAQRDYANTRYDYVVNSLKLKRAAGTINAKDLETINGWLRAGQAATIAAQSHS